jgi:uncharacterized protein YndB with AHSA1/START domain
MKDDFIAYARIVIKAPVKDVWDALVNPEKIKQYMFGTEVVTDWKENDQILWKGIWEGKSYEDKGFILKIIPEKYLQYSHFSPLSGKPDVIGNYHTLTFELSVNAQGTEINLAQDNNHSQEEKIHSEQMYNMMLGGIKTLVEK